MPNPSGENGGQFVPEPRYGEIQRLQENQKSAPMAGDQASASAVNAPRRAGAAAKRGDTVVTATPQEPQATGPFQPMAEGKPYELQVAEAWAELARDPKASPLIREYAAESAKLAGLED